MSIQLFNDQSAEPGQCGSCYYFDRRDGGGKYETHGICKFRLPPTKVYVKNDELQEVDFRTVRDTDGCDLYKPLNVGGDPVQFQKMRYWPAGGTS